MPTKYLRGALVVFTESFPLPVPNVITFQFNPETMTHSWTPAKAADGGTPGHPSSPLAITGSPQETFSFTLAMDAGDMIAEGGPGGAIATRSGVYSRLAALEMLLYPSSPPGAGLIGSVSASLSVGGSGISLGGALAGALGGQTRPVPAAQLPLVLFVWGPGRIVPVRVAQLTITEKLYDSDLLNPTHAEAQIQLKVLTQEELQFVNGPLGAVAKASQVYSDKLRQGLAQADRANAVQSVIGLLPI
jgi:hypothetical protein